MSLDGGPAVGRRSYGACLLALAAAMGCRSQGGPAEASGSGAPAEARRAGERAATDDGRPSAEHASSDTSERAATDAERAAAVGNAFAAHAVAGPSPGALEFIDMGPGRYALRALGPLRLGGSASLERLAAPGTYLAARLPGGFRLGRCAMGPGASDCIDLDAGGVLGPFAYDGGDCAGACCPPAALEALPPATFRWLVTACGAPATRWPGPDFTLPATAKALARARAAARLESVTAMRLDPLDTVESTALDAARVAGVAIIGGSEVSLAPERLAALVAWLEGPGFNDHVVRRCQRSSAFGFRGWRRAPGLEPEETEVAVDLGCNSIGVIHREGQRRLRSDAFFDASREPLVAIVKGALPDALPAQPRP